MSGHRHFMPDGQATGFAQKPAAGSALVVGQIETVVGLCSLTRLGGDPFKVKPGDPVCQGDIIETTSGGKVGIRFIDGTAFNLSDSAHVVVKEFGCDGAEPFALFDINRGTFAFIAGEMAKYGGLRVQTPFASIRGRAQSGGIGMLSLASLFFAAIENAQGLTIPPGPEDGIIGIRDSTDIINAPFGIIELTVGGQTIFIDNPFFEWIVRGTSVSQVALSPTQLLQHQVESNNVSNIASLAAGPTVGGPSGSSGLPPPEPPPFVTPINNVVPTGSSGPTSGQGGGGGGGPPIIAPQDIPPPPPPPPPSPLPPPGPNEINELADTTGNSTVHETSGSIPSTILSLNSPTFTWTGGPITDPQKALLADIVWSGGPLSDAQKAAVAAATTLPSPGSTTFDFEIVDSAVDFVAFGETVKLTYQVTFTDGSTQPVVVTVFGTNDLPVINASTNPASAAIEVVGDSHAQDIPQTNGTITIKDADINDALSFVTLGNATALYNGGPVPNENSVNLAALIASGAITFDPIVSSGQQQTINWHYNPAAADLDWLRDGDTLTLTFTVRLQDNHGGFDTQNLVITITGTEDVPVIDSATNPAPIPEIAGDSSAQNIPQQNGTISITDQDLGDTLTVTVTGNATASYKPSGGVFGALPVENSVNVAALIASGAISFDPALSNGEQVVIGWHYDPAAADLDWLRAGDTLTITYLAQVNDGQGNVGNQQLVITITGTNDVPSFSGVTNPAPIAEIAGNSSAQDIAQQNGTITVTDQDLGDPLTLSITGSATALYNGGAVPAAFTSKITALLASSAVTFDAANSNGEQQVIGWHYNPAAADLDWLAQGDTLTITYVARVNDGSGNVGAQNLVITITGTNDAPVIKTAGSYSFDQFNTQDYGAWVEQGNNSNGAVNGNPLDGEFQIAHDPLTAAGDFQIRLTDLDAESAAADTLTRTFNLVGAGNTAKLEFDYRRDIPSGQSNDQFIVYASINGGAFVQIGQIGATGNGSFVDGSYQHFTFDLASGSQITTVALRFSVGDDVDDGDVVYVDNVKLSYATTASTTQTINYTENSAVGILPPQITDVDNNATIHSATITITNHQANDLLSVTGSLPGGITASSYDTATGVLTLTGNASLANYQDALSHILFSNTSDNPSTVDRTLEIKVNDGMADSNVATATIHVTAIDDIPLAGADNVITNFGTGIAFQIPNAVLLANDDNTLSITGVTPGTGGTPTFPSGVVTFNDTGGSGGSFSYTATDGALTTSAQVTVTQHTSGALDGTSGNDILIAKPGAVTMNGNGGDDILVGNTGAQIMNGNAGNDTFVFRTIADSTPGAGNFDTVGGFVHNSDHLDLTAIADATIVQGLVNSANTVDAHSISWFIDNVQSQTIVYVNTTGTPNHVDMEIHLTGTNINLSGSDILHHT